LKETTGATTPKSINVTVYADAIGVATLINETLTGGKSVTYTFSWNTTGWAYGNYTISAYVWPVEGETDTNDNILTDGWTIIALIGDITGLDGWPDGKCDMRDVGLIASHFGENTPPAPVNCDITGPVGGVPDGRIDMRDIGLIASHFGNVA